MSERSSALKSICGLVDVMASFFILTHVCDYQVGG